MVSPKGLLQQARDGLRDLAPYSGRSLLREPFENGVDAQEADRGDEEDGEGEERKEGAVGQGRRVHRHVVPSEASCRPLDERPELSVAIPQRLTAGHQSRGAP